MELTEALVHQEKSLILILVKWTQTFVWVYIIMVIIIICLLMEKKSLNLKLTIKMFTFQLCLGSIFNGFGAICVNLIFTNINGYFEEIAGNRYLTLILTNESKEKIKKCEEPWIKIRDLIKSVTKISGDYDEKYMRIKFDTDDKLPLNKEIKIPIITIVVRAVFHENNKCYTQVFLDKCLYEI